MGAVGSLPGFRRRAIRSNHFVSTEQTGTGASQNVAHGLGVTPSRVLAVPSEGDGNAMDIAYGVHTSTNCLFTAGAAVKFYVHAWP